MGGNPGSVSKMSGDLPASIEPTNRSANMDLAAVLMGRRASHGMSQRGGSSSGGSGPNNTSDMKIPAWIEPGAHICYLSRSTGNKLEVVVEMVDRSRGEVEISSVEGGVWKVIPFAAILSSHNPLFPPSTLPESSTGPLIKGGVIGPAAAPAAEKDEVEVVGEASGGSAKRGGGCVDLTDNTAKKSRSRSPKR